MGKELDRIIRVMARTHGRDISPYDETFLAKSLDKRLAATGNRDLGGYGAFLSENSGEAKAFSDSLNITYSEFFRDPLAFALLEELILPDLFEDKARNSRGEIRIWSAGCAGGQEAWSVAILLEEMAAARERPAPFRIFATDLSEGDPTRERGGVFSAAAVGNVRLRHLDGYLSRKGDSFVIAPRIRARVDFSPYDLLDQSTSCPPASIYGDFDLVLCCNVLLYYRPEARGFLLDKVRRALAPGGYLIAGETERQIVESAGGFRAVAPPAAVFRQTRRRR